MYFKVCLFSRIPQILAATKAFWAICQLSDPETMNKKEYRRLHLRLQKLMLEEYDARNAVKLADEEFETDRARNGNTARHMVRWVQHYIAVHCMSSPKLMTRVYSQNYDNFSDSLFETADMWTDDIDGGLYARFLWYLFHKLAIVTTPPPRLRDVDDLTCCADELEDIPDLTGEV